MDRLQHLVEEMTQVSSRGDQIVDTTNDDGNIGSVHHESITINDKLGPAEDLFATDDASPEEAEVSLNDKDDDESGNDEVEPHESKDTLLGDPEDETTSPMVSETSDGFDDDVNSDPFATYDASARSNAMSSAWPGNASDEAEPQGAVKSPLKRFMQNRTKNQDSV